MSEPTADDAAEATRRYGRGAAVLSAGIGVTGLVTYGFFALASHNLPGDEYGQITLLWSAVFITVSVLYRPVEQLLSRTIAERGARGAPSGDAMKVAAQIQGLLGVVFAVGVLLLRGPIEDGLFLGNETLYWILVGSVLAYAVSYFARGFLAGNRRFGLYGLLVLMEATSRISFAAAVATGVATGQTMVALGILAAPLISLLVVPFALRRRSGGPGPPATHTKAAEAAASAPGGPEGEADDKPPADVTFTLAHGGGFATAVLLIMVAEQTFLNAGPILIKVTEGGAAGAALAGFVFNVLLIARAPLQLFQAIATSLLPHLTNLRSLGGDDAFRHSIRVTLIAVALFAGSVALVMLVAGPKLMQVFFGESFSYEREGLVIVSGGMGLYLASATLNQAALARGQARLAAGCWIGSAAIFVALIVLPVLDPVRRVQVAFGAAAALLFVLLYLVYRSDARRLEDEIPAGSAKEVEARLAAADEAT